MSNLLDDVIGKTAELMEEQRLLDAEEAEARTLEAQARELIARRAGRKNKIAAITAMLNHSKVILAVNEESAKASQARSDAEAIRAKMEADHSANQEKTKAMQDELAAIIAKAKETKE